MSNEHTVAKLGLVLAALTLAGSFFVPEVRQFFGIVIRPAGSLAHSPPTLTERGPPGSFHYGAITPESTAEEVIRIYGNKKLYRKRFNGVDILSYTGASLDTIVSFNCDPKTSRVQSVQIFSAENAKQFAPYFGRTIDDFVSFAGVPNNVTKKEGTVELDYELRDTKERRGCLSALFWVFANGADPQLYSVFLNWNPT